MKVVSGTWATASLSAFLLKVVLEEKLGFPTLLISDYDDMFNDTESVIEGLARGDAHVYPEVRWCGSVCMVAVACSVLPVRRECFDAHALVRKARSRSPLPAGLEFSRGRILPALHTRGDGADCQFWRLPGRC